MASKSTHLILFIRVTLITLSAVLLGFLLFETKQYPLASLVVIAILVQTFLLIDFSNKTNKKITYFFDAVRNDDSSLHFSEDVHSKTERFLNISLNKVNRLIHSVKEEQISQEKYYSYILEKAITGFMTIDGGGHVLLTNSAAQNLLGYEHLTHISQLSRINEKLFLAFETLKAGENKVVKFNNEKELVQLSLKPSSVTIKNKELLLVAINNIRSELEEQEIESWLRLIRVLTHEIMNSVAPITSLAETLGEFYEDKEQVAQSGLDNEIVQNTIRGLNIIKQRGEGLITFVDSYRNLTKIPIPKKKSFEVQQFLDSIRILVSQEENFKKTKMTIDVSDEVDNILADKDQLTQVLINLTKNALEALNEREEGLVTLKAQKENEKVSISVADNGEGISDEVKEQIFIPFFTTKEKGTGIGLSLSHHIMRMHGGQLRVNSELGKGTEFTLVV
ncbi:MAG: GHKL domain-containing protein [Cyclobacteriaceae bacterium]